MRGERDPSTFYFSIFRLLFLIHFGADVTLEDPAPLTFFFLFMFLNGRRRKNVFGGEEEDGKGKKKKIERPMCCVHDIAGWK
jgi:hypothetical protein